MDSGLEVHKGEGKVLAKELKAKARGRGGVGVMHRSIPSHIQSPTLHLTSLIKP